MSDIWRPENYEEHKLKHLRPNWKRNTETAIVSPKTLEFIARIIFSLAHFIIAGIRVGYKPTIRTGEGLKYRARDST